MSKEDLTMMSNGSVFPKSNITEMCTECQERLSTITNIPENFDARTKWPHCKSLRTIRNQGVCGSCWAVSSAATISDRFCIAINGSTQFEFSAEDILTCCSTCMSTNNGCEGGMPIDAWKYWIDHGVVSGGKLHSNEVVSAANLMRYFPFNTRIIQFVNTAVLTDKRFGKNVYKISNNVKEIQGEIMTNGPVLAGFRIYEDFYLYKSGVYVHTAGESRGIHAIRIIGWGVDKKKRLPYWLAANSWGKMFGERGLIKTLRGENHCGIEENVIA
ncbi:Peptidase C1 domain containing protein, partial [Asbolus verrucosus]